MGIIINIFDRQVNASASALCNALGFKDREKFPLTRFALNTIYKRAYESPQECRSPAEIREDFTGFRQDIKQSLPRHKQSINLFLGREDTHPDFMIALCIGHDVLATASEAEMAQLAGHEKTLTKVSKQAHHFVNSCPYVEQSNIDDMQPLELFTLLVSIRDHFHPLLQDLESYGARPNQYTLSAIQKNLGILEKFRLLDLGNNDLSRSVSRRLHDIAEIDRNYGLSDIGKQFRRPTHP